MTELMHDNPIHAPLDQPQSLVDVGCRNGIITCILGNLYPAAKVYGIDKSPVPSFPPPANIQYIVGDIQNLLGSDERLQSDCIDFISSRSVIRTFSVSIVYGF